MTVVDIILPETREKLVTIVDPMLQETQEKVTVSENC